ncbi:MAG TPA: ABC transporter ATP-binding protein [Chloroflexota bacterium]|nr:ABC transporter ATP-binding protein [Chloroflexota bacterium]
MLLIESLTKRFGPMTAVDDLDLEIREGEFFTFLGPSGCGKTTTLRCIGGLEKPDAGAIRLGSRALVDVNRRLFVPPERRNMGMVFQSYALWPHMTVFENVAYPLKLRRTPRTEIRRRVEETLRLVGLGELSNRQAPQLSGGQQQRVALARALVFSPEVLLLDEPLSNLDALLRDEMRRQLKELQARLGVTTIFVTHDQVEALSVSDRIAIMNNGHLEQLGTPRDVYTNPATPFAQSFLGRTLTVDGRVTRIDDGAAHVALVGVEGVELTASRIAKLPRRGEALHPGDLVQLSIRPEQIAVTCERAGNPKNVVPARIRSTLFVGDRFEYVAEVGQARHVLSLPTTQIFNVGDEVYLELPPEALCVWPG